MKRIINKTSLLTILALILLILPFTVFAQIDDLPCGGDDPYATECPLDTWVWVLIVGAAAFGTSLINRNKEPKNFLQK
ncbi:hypothetical protein ACFQZX_01180 [Mucilaginibacter litoreus]|uniref:Uncharacterized protein n=1 Tax=Mucilaginibacter litoreus TaxID=1048221 RepID=A0ABW3AMG1_9SPHI